MVLNLNTMAEKPTAIITGATGAIGKAIATKMAERGFYTIMAVRNETKAKTVAEEIRTATKNNDVHYVLVDFSQKKEIERIASEIDTRIHVLINNAATTPGKRLETAEGIEMQWAVNVLGYYWMIQNFLPHLSRASEARIVNVASYWAGGLDLNDPEFKKRPYDNDSAYRQSKQADRMLTVAFAEILKDKNITVNACHPGDVNSKLSNDLGFGGSESPEKGAATPVWVATEKEGATNTGRYFAHMSMEPCQFSSDKQGIIELFRLCGNY
jgi:NAD(P)-dependent dehydrogenase (short-subunit alcohol dehydrogenase family)